MSTASSTTATTSSRSSVSGRQKAGLVISGLLLLSMLPSVLTPTPDGQEGPPFAVLVVSSLLGLAGLVALVPAWRGNRAASRVVAGSIIVSAVLALPAFFVDVPAWIVAASAITVLLSVLAVVLVLTPARRGPTGSGGIR